MRSIKLALGGSDEGLLTWARTLNREFSVPLADAEVRGVWRSVCRYKARWRVQGHRAVERQRAQAREVELSREPTVHLGPQASNMYPAPGTSDPVDPNDAVRERNRDREQARAEPDHEADETRTRISRLEDALEHIAAAIRETWDRITRARDERLRPPQPEQGWDRGR